MLRKVVYEFQANEGSSVTANHNLGTKDVLVQVYDVDTGETLDLDVAMPNENDVSVTFGDLGERRAFRVVIIG